MAPVPRVFSDGLLLFPRVRVLAFQRLDDEPLTHRPRRHLDAPGRAVDHRGDRLQIRLERTPGTGGDLRSDAAKVLGVLPKTVAHWCEAGKLPDAQKTSPGKGGRWRIPAVSVYRLGTPAPRAPRLWKAKG